MPTKNKSKSVSRRIAATKESNKMKSSGIAQAVAKIKKQNAADGNLFDFREGDFTKRTPKELQKLMEQAIKAFKHSSLQAFGADGVDNESDTVIYKSGVFAGMIAVGYSAAQFETAWDKAMSKLTA